MPRKPKQTSRSGRPAAERPFVDREEFLAPVQSALREPERTKPLVLVYYGGAGIGKSRLRRELVKQFAADPGVVTATLDFDVPIYRQPDAALLYLRKAVGEAYKVRFPSFDLAYAALWQKAHPDVPLGDDLRPLLDPGSLLSQQLDDSGKLPLIGLIPKIAKAVRGQGIKESRGRVKETEGENVRGSEGAADAGPLESSTPGPLESSLADWWQRRGERELEDLPQMEPGKIVEQLPKLWAADLKDYISEDTTRLENRGQSPGAAASNSLRDSPHFRGHVPARRAVLFIDSYEKLRGTGDGGRETEDGRQKTDEWVRELVKQLPEALWIVCGRQKLRWEEVDKGWGTSLSQHELSALPDASARRFLVSCGITNEPIQDAIVKGSQGVPHYLDLAVDTLERTKDEGQGTRLTGDSPNELQKQFIRHLDQPEIEALQVLSAPRFWYYELFENLMTEYQTGYPPTAYDDLARFSFVKEGAAPGTRTMHDLMREALQEEQSPELRKRVHLFLHELYAKQLEGLDVKGITEKHKAALTEAFYHGRQAKSAAELWSWFEATSDVFVRAHQSGLLVPLYRETIEMLEAERGPNRQETATARWRLAIGLERLGRLDESEQQHRRALATRENVLGPEHPDIAQSLNDLSLTLHFKGRYAEAEQASRRALGVREKTLGPEHPETGDTLTGLARSLYDQGKYAEAEPIFRRALAIAENALGSVHPVMSQKLDNLASILDQQGKYVDAEPLFRRALVIAEKTLGPVHPTTANVLGNLAINSKQQAKYAEAELLCRRALAIYEEKLGPNSHHVARILDCLAGILKSQGKYSDEELLYRRALAVAERTLGPEHPEVARILGNLSGTLWRLGRLAEAEQMDRRSLAIREKTLSPEHPHIAYALNSLGVTLAVQRKYPEAEPLLRRAITIWERTHGPEHPDVAEGLNNLSMLLRQQRRYGEAEPLSVRALTIVEKFFGPEHPQVASRLHGLAILLRDQGKYDEAEPLLRRALSISENALGPEHPVVPDYLVSLSMLLARQGKHAGVEPLARRALAVLEARRGPDHPRVADASELLAGSLVSQGKNEEAELLARRALVIREGKLGPNHPDVADTLDVLIKVCEQSGRAAEAQEYSARAQRIRARASSASG